MGQVKAPDVPQPKRGLTDFERKIADILFAETSTNELPVERVLDIAIVISNSLQAESVREEAILRRAIEVYGRHAQINMALEKMGELIVALQHWLRGRVSYVEVCEEVADVQIMMEQLAMIFDKDIVRKYYESKIKRLEQRLNKED